MAAQRPLALVMALGLVGLISAAVLKAGDAIGTVNQGAGIDIATDAGIGPDGVVDPTTAGDANIKQLAENLYNDHVLAFELTSVLLIVAVAGTVLLTRKWPKAEKATT